MEDSRGIRDHLVWFIFIYFGFVIYAGCSPTELNVFSHRNYFSLSLSLYFNLASSCAKSFLSWDPWCQYWFHLLHPSSDDLKFCQCFLHVSQKTCIFLSSFLPCLYYTVVNWLIQGLQDVSRIICFFLLSFFLPPPYKASLYSTGLKFSNHQFSSLCLLHRGRIQ